MAYQFDFDETIDDNVRRIVVESINESIALIDNPEVDDVDVVHEIRKHCKKNRALFQLVSLEPGQSLKAELQRYRIIARSLSRIREVQIWVPVFAKLVSDNPGAISEDAESEVTELLTALRLLVERDVGGVLGALSAAGAKLAAGRPRSDEWLLENWSVNELCQGLLEGRSRAIAAAEKAVTEPTEKRFHDWRKRVKTHWYHIRLVEPVSPEGLSSYRESLYQLADTLGSERDLFTLLEGLHAIERRAESALSFSLLFELIGAARSDLRGRAMESKTCVQAWDPDPVIDRLRLAWPQLSKPGSI